VFHYRVGYIQPLVPILSQINPVCTLTLCFFNGSFNMFFHLRLGLPGGVFLSCFFYQNFLCTWWTRTAK